MFGNYDVDYQTKASLKNERKIIKLNLHLSPWIEQSMSWQGIEIASDHLSLEEQL